MKPIDVISHRPPWAAILAIVLLGAIGGVIRYGIATTDLLWLDELHTSWVVGGDFSKVAERAAEGNQVPFYFWLTWIPVQLFGESELTNRAISLIGGFGLLLTAPWICWKWTRSSIAAVTVGFLIAFDLEQFIYYGTEARPYSLLQWLGLIQVALFWRVIRELFSLDETGARLSANQYGNQATKLYVGLSIVSTGLIYVHFTAIWIFVAEFVFLAVLILISWLHRWDSRRSLIPVGITMLSVIAFCIPAFFQLWKIFGRKGNWEGVSSISKFWAIQESSFVTWIGIPLLGWLVLRFAERRWSKTDPINGRASAIVGCLVFFWAVAPSACIIALTWFETAPIALRRYVQVGAVAFPLFAGLAIGRLSTRLSQSLLALVVVAASVGNDPFLFESLGKSQIPILRFEDWKSPAAEVAANHMKRTEPLFLFGNLIEDADAFQNERSEFQEYLRFPIWGLYKYESMQRETIVYPTMTFSKFRKEHLQEIHKKGGAWIVVRAAPSFVQELIAVLSEQLSSTLDRSHVQFTFSIFESPSNDVYLISVDGKKSPD